MKIVQADEIFLINKLNDNFCTTSRIIAKALNKRHSDLLRDIKYFLSCISSNEKLNCNEKVNIINQFQETIYKDKKNRPLPEYQIKCAGFIQLIDMYCVGGIQNERILAWKVQLNKRYFDMEREIMNKNQLPNSK